MNEVQATTSVIIARVISYRHIDVKDSDLDMIRGLWRIKVLSKLENVELSVAPRIMSSFIRRDFFRVWNTQKEKEFSPSLLGQLIKLIENKRGIVSNF